MIPRAVALGGVGFGARSLASDGLICHETTAAESAEHLASATGEALASNGSANVAVEAAGRCRVSEQAATATAREVAPHVDVEMLRLDP